MNLPVYCKSEIKESENIGSLYHRLRVSLSQSIGPVAPGQFAMLSLENGSIVLPRPFSIHNFENGERTAWLDFLFKVVGKGTAHLAKLSAGSPITILAPLGNGFPDPPSGHTAVIVAGGMGIAPLFPLITRLATAPSPLSVLYGAKSHQDLVCLPGLRNLEKITITTTTEDGSGGGEKGLVTQLLKRHEDKGGAKTVIYACGPESMLHVVSAFAGEKNIPCWMSIERWMACGVGACLSCVVNTTSGYRQVCSDGPIFDAKDIIWRDDARP